jgi:hypothetical protein
MKAWKIEEYTSEESMGKIMWVQFLNIVRPKPI